MGPTPVYDSWSSLGFDLEPEDIVDHAGESCKPFADYFGIQMGYVKDLSWLDRGALRIGIAEAGGLGRGRGALQERHPRDDGPRPRHGRRAGGLQRPRRPCWRAERAGGQRVDFVQQAGNVSISYNQTASGVSGGVRLLDSDLQMLRVYTLGEVLS